MVSFVDTVKVVAEILDVKQDARMVEDYNVLSQTPEGLGLSIPHTTYTSVFTSPREFLETHTSDILNLDDLIKEASYLMPDILCKNYSYDDGYQSLDFCAKVLFTIGPESRQFKKNDENRFWRYKLNNSKAIFDKYNVKSPCFGKVACIYVSTYKIKPNSQPVLRGNTLHLTIKQATLLALTILEKITILMINKNKIILTPLAGAVFPKKDILGISKAIKMGLADTICIINNSCQSGGHNLIRSRTDVAAIAAIVATQGMSKKDSRMNIVRKISKQFHAAKRVFDEDAFTALSKFATGGVPQYLETGRLIGLFEQTMKQVRTNALEAVKTTNDMVPISGLAGLSQFMDINEIKALVYENLKDSNTIRNTEGDEEEDSADDGGLWLFIKPR